ncbi:MAG: type II toxin-antitoxin system RelE/ParE family toxin [Opitutaceae bacterium]|nr:type II toxin-antitoxin system RelE/ParE family toxin [Cytophagales bacterium]
MDKQIREVVLSLELQSDLESIFNYGHETFGLRAAESFLADLIFRVESLAFNYELYPECVHLKTQARNYRNFFIGSYLVVYRITEHRIEVLRAFHSSRSINAVKSSKKLRLSL